jgi:endonuclease/exonuclease/phosphatase family metal-dependent hydrolase
MRTVRRPEDTRSSAARAAARDDLARIGEALGDTVPAKRPGNLLVGTWNIRAFGALTATWQAGPRDTPKRDWHAVQCIAEVIRRFDVTAVQEARRNPASMSCLLELLGPAYRLITSDVTEGERGNGERLAFVYDGDRVQPSGLVGEVVLPHEAGSPSEQFARTPYAAGFVRGGVDFVLTTVHVLWGKRPEDRIGELAAFASWMRDWAERPDDWNRNLLVLGDFNLDRRGDPLYTAFLSTGLWPPAELEGVPRTIFDNDRTRHFYDQIAWFSDTSRPGPPSLLDGLTYTRRGGSFDFVPHVLRELTPRELSWRISDHYPLWVELAVDPGR